MKKRKILEILIRKKPCTMLALLTKGKKYISLLAKQADCTYSHTVKLLRIMEKAGFVRMEKKGRTKYVTLTKQGADIATRVVEIFEILGYKL